MTIDTPGVGPDVQVALLSALLARGTGMRPLPYRHLKALALQGPETGADAAVVTAVCALLVAATEDVALESLDLVQCGGGITPLCCGRLGASLMLGGNSSLRSLRLDLNRSVGDEGEGREGRSSNAQDWNGRESMSSWCAPGIWSLGLILRHYWVVCSFQA